MALEYLLGGVFIAAIGSVVDRVVLLSHGVWP